MRPNLRISFNYSYFGLDWIVSAKIDPCPTLTVRGSLQRSTQSINKETMRITEQ